MPPEQQKHETLLFSAYLHARSWGAGISLAYGGLKGMLCQCQSKREVVPRADEALLNDTPCYGAELGAPWYRRLSQPAEQGLCGGSSAGINAIFKIPSTWESAVDSSNAVSSWRSCFTLIPKADLSRQV